MKYNLSTKALSFILSVSLLTTKLPVYSNVNALIPQSDEVVELTREELAIKENKENLKQAIDNDDVNALHDAFNFWDFGVDFNKLRFKYTFDFTNGKDIELPVFHYAIAKKSLKCFKYLLLNDIDAIQETVTIPGLDIPLDSIAIAAISSTPKEVLFLKLLSCTVSIRFEENASIWAAVCLDHKHFLMEYLINHFDSRSLEIPRDCLEAGLFGAALGNDLYSLKELMKKGATINSIDSKGRTLLHLSAISNSTEVAKFLIENHADVNSKDSVDNTPLHLAVKSNSVDVVNILIQNGAKLDVRNFKHSHITPLNLAAKENNVFIFNTLRKNGADIFTQSKIGMALHHAARGDSLDIAKLLIEEGVDPNIISQEGLTPLHYAAYYNSPKVAKLLIDSGANIEAKSLCDGCTPLHRISCFRGVDVVARLLIESGANVNQTSNYGYTPLHLEMYRGGRIEILDLLISSGANVNCLVGLDETPLSHAFNGHRVDVMKFLISKGADVNQLDRKGRSLLHLAVERNDIAAVELLIDSGANVDVKDSNGKTPIDIATDPVIISLLQGNSTSN